MDKRGIKVTKPKEAAEGDYFFQHPGVQAKYSKDVRVEKSPPKNTSTTVSTGEELIVSRKGITVILPLSTHK